MMERSHIKYIAVAAIIACSLLFVYILMSSTHIPINSTEPGPRERVIWPEDLEALKNPFLWRIEGETVSYLYGTHHAPDYRILAIPNVVGRAFEDADEEWGEVSVKKEDQAKLNNAFLLPEGQQLSDILPKEFYAKLESYLNARGISLEDHEKFKPWYFLLHGVSGIRESVHPASISLDQCFLNLARLLDKKRGGLETVDDLIAQYESLSIDEQIKLLELAMVDNYWDMYEKTILSYTQGDENAIEGGFEQKYGWDESLLNLRSIYNRNKIMAERIADKLDANPDKSFFFVVGVAHYLGEGSIIDLLQEKGYTITKVVPETEDERSLWIPEIDNCRDGYVSITHSLCLYGPEGWTEKSNPYSNFPRGEIVLYRNSDSTAFMTVYSWNLIKEYPNLDEFGKILLSYSDINPRKNMDLVGVQEGSTEFFRFREYVAEYDFDVDPAPNKEELMRTKTSFFLIDIGDIMLAFEYVTTTDLYETYYQEAKEAVGKMHSLRPQRRNTSIAEYLIDLRYNPS